MKKILIIGATSAIAEHAARIWATRGDSLFLVARNQERLQAIANDLQVRGANQVDMYLLDVNLFDQHAAMLEQAETTLGGIDIVFVAHGTLSDQNACENNVAMTLHEISTNALSIVSLLTLVANRLEEKRHGTIAVISSVAGERGRASNYVYGCAKAMVTTFLSGMRQRLGKSGVTVVTVLPGQIDTPMTASFAKGLLWAKPQNIAKSLVRAIDGRQNVVYLPWFWRYIMLAIKLIPISIFQRIRF